MSTMEEMLVSRYGVLLTLADCAALLNRSADGLRILLYKDLEISYKLRAAKVKIWARRPPLFGDTTTSELSPEVEVGDQIATQDLPAGNMIAAASANRSAHRSRPDPCANLRNRAGRAERLRIQQGVRI
ncbi:hypothetical protein [Ralstonia pickettii]|uniref:hypothetical protein n=1 Tax=Ralstonia pickettii TaxID=329 RepID=UPI0029C9F602|nr:hypothetical protein [Ralstonia pickettii]